MVYYNVVEWRNFQENYLRQMHKLFRRLSDLTWRTILFLDVISPLSDSGEFYNVVDCHFYPRQNKFKIIYKKWWIYFCLTTTL